MSVVSRREFAALVAALPAVSAFRALRLGGPAPPIGVTTSSFSDLPRVPGRGNVDDVIRAVQRAGVSRIELALQNVEPAPPSTAPVMGGTAAYPKRIVLTPEQIAATDTTARAALRAWRASAAAGVCTDVRRRFRAAGITVDTCAVSYNDSFTDAELDATLRQVTALELRTVSSPLTLAMARRLAPFAERHRVSIAIRNQVDGNAAGLIDSAQLAEALSLSPRYTLALDVGNLTASNRDAVAVLREQQPRVSSVILTDRLRNGGASQPFGEGDTPLQGVLELLAVASPAVPALIHYDYTGLRSSVEEVRDALAYVSQLLPAA